MRQAAQGAQVVDGYDMMATGIRVFLGGSNVDQASIHSFLLGHGPFNKKKQHIGERSASGAAARGRGAVQLQRGRAAALASSAPGPDGSHGSGRAMGGPKCD